MKRLTAFIMLIAFLVTPCEAVFASDYGLSSAGDNAFSTGKGAVSLVFFSVNEAKKSSPNYYEPPIAENVELQPVESDEEPETLTSEAVVIPTGNRITTPNTYAPQTAVQQPEAETPAPAEADTAANTGTELDASGDFVSAETFDAEIYPDGIILSVPLIAQIGPSCGPTSLAMCISYLNKVPLDSDWAHELYNRIGHGTGGFAYGLKENSLAQDVYAASEMTESLLQSELEKGHPVIVLISGPNELSGPDGHIEVIKGYRSGRYYLNDPNLSRELTHREGISFAFNDFHKYALTYFVIRHREGEGW